MFSSFLTTFLREKTAVFKDAPQDNIYVIESLIEKGNNEWKVKWLGFPIEESTWEPTCNIQPWILSFYEEDHSRFGKPLPDPTIKHVKRAGDETYYYLSWGNDRVKGNPWKGKDFFTLASEDGELVDQLDDDKTCNTIKTKDKRERRHTAGIMVGTKPCGTVVLFDEIYRSESLSQVYGMLIEYVANLPLSGRDKLKHLLYDDACHLKKFSEDSKRAGQNEFTQFFASVPKHVDNFHFKNHVDAWCHQHCNPKDVRDLDDINTESCEQTFKWVNEYKAVKSMNDNRFWMFFTLIFDYHNLQRIKKLRSVAHPRSPLRWDLLPADKEWEKQLLKKNQNIDSLEEAFDNISIDCDNGETFKCDDCEATYKKSWKLRQHIKNKHQQNQDNTSDATSDVDSLKDHLKNHDTQCQICNKQLANAFSLSRHMKTHEKPIFCKDCKEVFLTQNELKEHSKTHLVCKLCQKTCDSKAQFNRHLKSHK